MNSLPTFEQLAKRVNAIIATVKNQLANKTNNQLNYKSDINSWSALECLEHLNRYSHYYHTEITQAIQKVSIKKHKKKPSLTWFGKLSIKMVDPERQKKQKTIKRMNPSGSQLVVKDILTEFLDRQQELLQILEKAKVVNFNKKKVRVEFFKLLKLNIYESLFFLIVHEQRHIQQALKVIEMNPL